MYLMMNLYIVGTLRSDPDISSFHPRSMPKTQENRMVSASANTTRATVPAQ